MENQQDKKSQIIRSGLELINEHGFHGCPISQVAKKAGVAAGTIYTYFESKEEMIQGIFQDVIQRQHREVTSKDDPNLPFKERFFSFWDNLLEFYSENPDIQGFLEQFLKSPYNSEELQAKHPEWFQWTQNFYLDGIREGAIKDLNPIILKILVNESAQSLAKVKKNFAQKLERNQVDLSSYPYLIWDAIKAN